MTEAGYVKRSEGAVFDDDKTMPIVVHALYLLGFVTGGVSAIVGVIIAYVGLNESDWRRSHYLHAIYTFWLTLAGFVVAGIAMGLGVLLTATVIGAIVGVPLMIVAGIALAVPAVWFGVRAVLALIYASRAEAYPRPRTLLV